MTDFIAQLAAARKALGVSQQTVADRMEGSRTYVSLVENGHRDVSFSWLLRYADAIGCRVDIEITAPPGEGTEGEKCGQQ